MIVENFGSQDLKGYQYEIDRGGKFVVYQYCFSIILLTSKQSSGIYLIKGGENAVVKGLGYTFLTFFLGWWGIPWGPIYTIQTLFRNLTGGIDVTHEVMEEVTGQLDPQNQNF